VRGHLTLGSRYRRRGLGHDGRLIKAALAAALARALAGALALALAACASAPPKLYTPPNPAPGQAAGSSDAPYGVHPLPDRRERMVDTAASMLGQPYRFGGAAPGGFDCSGLVVYAAAGADIHVPRTAHEQLGFGKPIARGQVKAGDLVFMHLAHKELHVGIALDGERFIHAPSTGGHVRIDSLAASPYARGYLGARRIISTQ
jgi:cell wall-associated NlpC family hydrolase